MNKTPECVIVCKRGFLYEEMAGDLYLVDRVRPQAVRRNLFVAQSHHQRLQVIVKGDHLL